MGRWILLLMCMLPAMAGAQPLSVQVAQLEQDNLRLQQENAQLRQAAENPPITLQQETGQAPFAVHAHAVSAVQHLPMPERAMIEWSVDGTPLTQHGFNFGAVIDVPGQYTLRCVITPDGEKPVTYTRAVTVLPQNRRPVYVAAAGDDRNDGTTPQTAIRSARRVQQLLGNNTVILWKRGEQFVLDGPLIVAASNVILGSWGDESQPLPMLIHTRADRGAFIQTDAIARNIIVQDLAFDSADQLASASLEKNGVPDALVLGGTAITVRRCVFHRVHIAVNTNGQPRGMIVEGCTDADETSIRGYLVWGNGQDLVVRNNTCRNSTREHAVRTAGVERGQYAGNTLTNLDRTSQDKLDTAKGALVLQKGAWQWAEGNTLSGPSGVGPLGGKDGAGDPQGRLTHVVLRGNTFNGTLEVAHGTIGCVMDGNTLNVDGMFAIKLMGFSNSMQRGVERVLISGNKGVNNGARGGFLQLQARCEGVSLVGNTYAAPSLAPGSHHTAVVYVMAEDLGSFSTIDQNQWPRGKPQNYAGGGIMYIWPTWSDRAGYRTLEAWNAMPPVKADTFINN